ncbi:polysaccharide pyruvyl transferase family protein [Chloroflexota bacterium]
MISIQHIFSMTYNLGDRLIFDSIHHLIRSHVIENYQLFPQNGNTSPLWQSFHGLTAETRNIFGKPDLIIFGGQPVIGKGRDYLNIEISPSYFEEIPAFMFGVGARTDYSKDPPDDDYLSFAREYFPKFRGISARDKETFELLSEFNSNVYFTGDPAMFRFLKPICFRNDAKFISIFFRGNLLDGPPIPNTFWISLVSALKKEFDKRVLILVNDFRELERVRQISEIAGCDFIGVPNYEWYIPYLENSCMILGFRYHGCILAGTLGIPFLHISTDWRGESFIRSFDKKRNFSLNLHALKAPEKPRSYLEKAFDFVGMNVKPKSSVLEGSYLALTEEIRDKCVSILSRKENVFEEYESEVKARYTIMKQFLAQIRNAVSNRL